MSETAEGHAWLEELSHEECLAHLRAESVGRLAVVVHEYPVIVPVNFKLAETSAATWIALRTRPGNVIDQAPPPVAFEVDGVDPAHHEGWSVLVRGTMHHVDAASGDFARLHDAHPWLTARDAWLVIEPFSVSGRRLHAGESEWAFHQGAYL
jgi:nitroimidazol reductase NimA-like FMN-containing flavoprotein (pyridoxamine 5'-phosphate oxidase superfamily)